MHHVVGEPVEPPVINVQLFSRLNVSHGNNIGLVVVWPLVKVHVEASETPSAVVNVPGKNVRAMQRVHVLAVAQFHEVRLVLELPRGFLAVEHHSRVLADDGPFLVVFRRKQSLPRSWNV